MQKEQERNIEFLEKSLKELLGRKFAVACSSGTDALMFALISLNLKSDDEVLVTNFSWISSASCVSLAGATPVFCDVDLDTYHMYWESVSEMISDKTKAIVYPHLFGSMSDTRILRDICKDKGIVFIEDAAQALGSSLYGEKAGTIGEIATLSFNANKQVAGIAGGGAVLTDDKEKAVLFRKLRKHGEHEVLGYNSKMLGMNADFINFRLGKMSEYDAKRLAIAEKYDEALATCEVVLQKPTEYENHTYHKYVVRFKNKQIRDAVKEKIPGSGIHYPKPISEHPMYQNITHRKGDYRNAKEICDTILTLPMHPYLTDEEINSVTNTIMILA
jgi:UDP-2-acetamido-2-deoxy-ribo-hexuluronate aminotransferase